jgi:hypothetical protein
MQSPLNGLAVLVRLVQRSYDAHPDEGAPLIDLVFRYPDDGPEHPGEEYSICMDGDLAQAAGRILLDAGRQASTWAELPHPPGIVAAAEQNLHAIRERLDVLVHAVRHRLAEGGTQTQASIDVYLTLRYGDRSMAAAMGATAVMRIATQGEPAPATEPSGDDLRRP